MKPIPVLLVTYNRLAYTKQALESLCLDPGLPLELTIWDNASTDPGMQEWLNFIARLVHRNTVSPIKVVHSQRNVGLAPAMNWFFRQHADAPYVVKVDNDTVLPEDWLADLMEVMESRERGGLNRLHTGPGRWVRLPHGGKLGAVSGTCLRPPGKTATDWYSDMESIPFNDHTLYFNPACLGTGVLINMDMIRERGLLFEKFPRSPEAGPDDPCLISGWGAYIQEASAFEGWKFAMYSKVPVQLLNLKEDQVLSNDYPEYDAEVAKVREEGNRWWESVGGIEGVRKYVQEHGGLERLDDTPEVMRVREFYTKRRNLADNLRLASYWERPSGMHFTEIAKWPGKFPLKHHSVDIQVTANELKLLTGADNLALRSTQQFWIDRVKEHGGARSAFLTTSQTRINEFTERHMEVLKQYLPGKDVLEVGCGVGRMSWMIAQMAGLYNGVDFVPELISQAQDNLPNLCFIAAPADDLPFMTERFDVVVAIACLSSFAGNFDKILAELKRVLRPEGRILFLEEDFARIDWKMRS